MRKVVVRAMGWREEGRANREVPSPDSGEHILGSPDRQDVQRHLQERQRPQGRVRAEVPQGSPICSPRTVYPVKSGPGADCTTRESASTWLALTLHKNASA